MENLVGKQLRSYQVVSLLGMGGMATVYKAYQPRMDRYVALKILPRHLSNRPNFVARFSQEARVIARLEHPHIVPIYDFGEADGYTYLVMRLVEGGSLADLIQSQQRLEMFKVRRIIRQVGEALNYAHQQGVIHRDFKPGNVLIDEFDNCLLSDFGISKLMQATSHLTNTGGILGTPIYISPEQGAGDPIDRRSDIYSLGVVLYQMVTGEVPYQADTPMGLIYKHIHDPLPLPSQKVHNLPEPLERIILKGLAKRPEDRFQTALELVDTLDAASIQMEARPGKKPPPALVDREALTVSQPEVEKPPPVPLDRGAETISRPPDNKPPPNRGTMAGAKWWLPVALVLLALGGAGWLYKTLTAVAMLSVNSRPPHAMVYVDDGRVGPSPVELDSLSQGPHEVRVVLEGYETYTERVYIQKRRPIHVDAVLAPLSIGKLDVSSDPPGAELWVDGQRRGTTPVVLERLPAGRRRVVVKMEGYAPYEAGVTIAAQKTASVIAELAPIFGRLKVTSDPPGAVLYLDGELQAETPLTVEQVPWGMREIVLKLKAYEDWRGQVEVQSGETAVVSAQLAAGTGGLQVESSPTGARVTLDGKDVGPTPLQLDEVAGGAHRVGVSLPGYASWSQSVTVAAGETAHVQAELTTGPGKLQVVSTPAGAEVSVDGRKAGTTPLVLDAVKTGKRQVQVSLNGYAPWSKFAAVDAGRSTRIQAELIPDTGTLKITSNPPGAVVWVAGRQVGFTPLNLDRVKTGEHPVRVSQAGYQVWRQTVSVQAAKTTQIHTDLQTIVHTPKTKPEPIASAAAPEEKMIAAKQAAEKSGPEKRITDPVIDAHFVYIPPGKFMIGSPEHEEGHRYDERLQSVTLTRGFYLQTTEVTQDQWRTVMNENPSWYPKCGGNCPVEHVSWSKAQEFIRRLNDRSGSGKYRLPTEAEWEYACRAGTRTPFSTGRCLSSTEANFAADYPLSDCSRGKALGKPTSVARYSPNPWGLYDMHGNVWEWCADWHGDYPRGMMIDPTGPSSGSYRVYRGGSWYDVAKNCRAAIRRKDNPSRQDGNLGFRLAREP